MKDDNLYLMYSSDTTDEQAQAGFSKRYGQEPEKVFRLFPGREVLAGPIPSSNERQLIT